MTKKYARCEFLHDTERKKTCSPQPAHTEAPQHLFQSETQRRAALGPTFPPYRHRASASFCRKRPPVSQTSQCNQDCILFLSQTSWWISRKLWKAWMWMRIFWCWCQRVLFHLSLHRNSQSCYHDPIIPTLLEGAVTTPSGCKNHLSSSWLVVHLNQLPIAPNLMTQYESGHWIHFTLARR